MYTQLFGACLFFAFNSALHFTPSLYKKILRESLNFISSPIRFSGERLTDKHEILLSVAFIMSPKCYANSHSPT